MGRIIKQWIAVGDRMGRNSQKQPSSQVDLQFQSLSRVQFFATPWTAAHQASLSLNNSQSLLKLMSIGSVMPSHHLILCCPLLLLPSIFPSIRVFSNESVLRIRWPKYWSFSFSISPSNEYSGLISLGWTGWISLQSKGLSGVFSSTTVQKHQFFGTQLSYLILHIFSSFKNLLCFLLCPCQHSHHNLHIEILLSLNMRSISPAPFLNPELDSSALILLSFPLPLPHVLWVGQLHPPHYLYYLVFILILFPFRPDVFFLFYQHPVRMFYCRT